MMMRTKCAMLCVMSLLSFMAVSLASYGEDTLYVGINEDALFQKLDLKSDYVRSGVCEDGVGYSGPQLLGPDCRIHNIVLAVAASPELAEKILEKSRSGPRSPQWALPVAKCPYGDDGFIQEGGDRRGGRMSIRIQNAVFSFSWGGTMEIATSFAERAVAAIKEDRNIAPTGTFAETPQVRDVGLPDDLVAKAFLTPTPEFTGLGDKTKVHFAYYQGRIRVVFDSKSVGKVKPAPAFEREGPARLLLVAANDDNVFVWKDITATVGPAKQ